MKKIFITLIILISFSKNSVSGNADSGLVAFYPFSGNIYDQSGNGNNGTNYGATLTTDRFGNANSAYTFNRTYIEIPNSPSLQSPVNSITISFWTNISLWDNTYAAFIDKSNSVSQGQYGAVASSAPYVQTDLGGQYFRYARTLNRNVWYLISYTWDGQKLRYYLNGSITDSSSFSGTVTADNFPLEIGKHTSVTTKYLKGKMDDIRIYNRALSGQEILKLFYENTLSLKIMPEGLFNNQTLRLNKKDTVRVYIREAVSPYKILDSSKSVIDSVTLTGNFRTFVPDGSYYIAVRHRNSIETWSSNPVSFGGSNVSYDFTTFPSQAYGNNLANKGGYYCVFSGDINQDGTIDASDLSSTDNAAYNSSGGYILTDVTGDNFTDASDVSLVDNNARILVSEITPFSNQAPCNLTCDRFINWCGFDWCVRSSNEGRCYPGPNYIASGTDNVRIDSSGDLHLRITKRNGKYYCVVLFTVQPVSYGLFKFSLSSRIDNLDKNVVFGLFTWNDKNCITNANSELDIEFTRWGDAENPDVIEYSIQPTNGGIETDRFTSWPMQLYNKYSTHFINWTPSLIYFSSYRGNANPPADSSLISYWSFGTNHTPKSSLVCNSDPVLIPDPESDTRLIMNLWLDRGNYPSNDQEVEVIVHKIEYVHQFYNP